MNCITKSDLTTFWSLSTTRNNLWSLMDIQRKQMSNLRSLPIIHHHGYVCDLPPNHRFPMTKFHKVLNFLVKDGVILKERQLVEPTQLSSAEASCVHTREYVDRFFSGRTSEKEQRATGFNWSPGLASRVRFETGGTVLAARLSLERGLACSTAGGTHHAFPDRGAGFCLINDLAVAAQLMISSNKVERVLIVDLDVHQVTNTELNRGDGTAFIFKDTDSVFTFSMHCGKNFPFRKQRSDLDIALDVNMGDDEFISILKDHLPSLMDSFRPGLVLYDAGVDPHQDDLLGKLRLTDEGLFKRDEFVLSEAVRRGIPVTTVIGGGYDKSIDRLALRHTLVHRAATRVWAERGL